MSHEIKPLGETGYMLIRETYITRSTVKAVKTTTITFDDGYSRTEEEEVEVSRDTVCHYEDIYLFNQNQYDTMVRNYELGGCPITEKGLRRYSLAYGSGTNWYGQPGRWAREFAKKGIPVPKELYGMMACILNGC